MDRLVKEQLLDKDVVYEGPGKPGREVVRFGYDRFAAHLVTARLLEKYVDRRRPAEALSAGRPLCAVADGGRTGPVGFADRSLLDALVVQFPERFGVELLSVLGAGTAAGTRRRLSCATLPWRKPGTVTGETARLLDTLAAGPPGMSHEWMLALLQVATRPDHPLNARHLHDQLARVGLVERDRRYVPLLLKLAQPSEFDETGAVGRLVEWAYESPAAAAADPQTAELAAIVLGWVFAVTDRPLRDRATKAMVRLLQDRPGTLAAVVERFRPVDDPYVVERVLAVAYGCCLRSPSRPFVRAVAECVYRAFFEPGPTPADVLTRDYARGVVEYARHLGVAQGVDLSRVCPPYNSDWIAGVPTEKTLKGMLGERTHGRDVLWQVWRSLDFEQSLGDFGIYSIGRHWSQFWRRGTRRRRREERLRRPLPLGPAAAVRALAHAAAGREAGRRGAGRGGRGVPRGAEPAAGRAAGEEVPVDRVPRVPRPGHGPFRVRRGVVRKPR